MFLTDRALPVKTPFLNFPEKPGVIGKNAGRPEFCGPEAKGVYSGKERV
jgi:hypothetical protein